MPPQTHSPGRVCTAAHRSTERSPRIRSRELGLAWQARPPEAEIRCRDHHPCRVGPKSSNLVRRTATLLPAHYRLSKCVATGTSMMPSRRSRRAFEDAQVGHGVAIAEGLRVRHFDEARDVLLPRVTGRAVPDIALPCSLRCGPHRSVRAHSTGAGWRTNDRTSRRDCLAASGPALRSRRAGRRSSPSARRFGVACAFSARRRGRRRSRSRPARPDRTAAGGRGRSGRSPRPVGCRARRRWWGRGTDRRRRRS